MSESETESSPTKAGSVNLNDIVDEANNKEEDELRIPVVMVLLVLVAYTGIGGFLFQAWEGWSYFEAFYFCFITMATIGFGKLSFIEIPVRCKNGFGIRVRNLLLSLPNAEDSACSFSKNSTFSIFCFI